jgi:HD-GYP domain-containing protein (c-di-GMP phosphodiesterase class II)
MNASIAAPELVPICVAALRPATVTGVDLYLPAERGCRPILFCARHCPLPPDDLARLLDAGVAKLYVERGAREAFQLYLREHLADWRDNDDLPAATRYAAMDAMVSDVLRESFVRSDAEALSADARRLGRDAATLHAGAGIDFRSLTRMLRHDYATFTHSVNVMHYALLLGKALGGSTDDLARIGAGGLIHDVGKIEIDERIIAKPGRLDEREYRLVQRHPTIGYRLLVADRELDFGQRMMIYQHHERVDGSGYPVGCDAHEIHPWAKLCAVVDVFEAITSFRPYRSPMTSETALQVLENGVGAAFDREVVRCWQSLVRANSTR